METYQDLVLFALVVQIWANAFQGLVHARELSLYARKMTRSAVLTAIRLVEFVNAGTLSILESDFLNKWKSSVESQITDEQRLRKSESQGPFDTLGILIVIRHGLDGREVFIGREAWAVLNSEDDPGGLDAFFRPRG